MPTRGVERWLTQRLSAVLGASPGRSDGVCANVEFPFPGRLVNGAVAAAAGVDRTTDPWLPERSVWPLLDVVESVARRALAGAAGGAPRRSGSRRRRTRRARRLSSVRHIADLYDRYAVHRPAMLAAWAEGTTTMAGRPSCGRRLALRTASASRARPSGWSDACARLRAEPASSTCPRACRCSA